MRVVVIERLILRCLNAGPLQPWLGPAVRGAVAKPWKSAVCQLSEAEQIQHKNCPFGCPHHDGCDYGRTVEPHAAGRPQQAGSTHIVFAPQYPCVANGNAASGTVVPLKLVLIGPAIESRETILNTLSESLRRRGFGEAVPVKCELMRDALQFTEHDLLPGDFPTVSQADGPTVPRVRIRLSSPLFLKQSFQQGRSFKESRPNHRPHLVDLLSPSLSLIERLFRQLGEAPPLDAASANLLKRAADDHPPINSAFEPFFQEKTSSRSEQVYRADGIVGEAVYAEVPLAILPWLTRGGRLHVGNHRVAGAGGWEVILD